MTNITSFYYLLVFISFIAVTFTHVIQPSLFEGQSMSDSKVMPEGSDHFVPNTKVLTIQHYHQAAELNDVEIPSQAWDERYYRIKTPLKHASWVMYRYAMYGYAYGEAKPIDVVWVGYLYYRPPWHERTFTEVKYISKATATTYFENGYLHLKVGPMSRYCNAFELHYFGSLYNATTGLQFDQYSVTATKD